jgi:hypothetical protein
MGDFDSAGLDQRMCFLGQSSAARSNRDVDATLDCDNTAFLEELSHCYPNWLHKARTLSHQDFQREVEKELTGQDCEPHELIYFKAYRSQIPVIEQAIEDGEAPVELLCR